MRILPTSVSLATATLSIGLLCAGLLCAGLLCVGLLCVDLRGQERKPNALDNDQWNDATQGPDAIGRHVPLLHKSTLMPMHERVRQQADSERQLQCSAWQVLAFAGNGSSLRSGYFKKGSKSLIRWIRNQQDERGTFEATAETAATRRFEHLLATVVIARTEVDSRFKLLLKNTRRGIDMVIAHYREDDVVMTDIEVALFAVLATTIRGSRWQPWREPVLELTRQGCAKLPKGQSRRSDTVRHLVARLDGQQFPHDLTIATCWPGDLARDPVHTWIAAFILRDLPLAVRKQQWPHAVKLMKARDAQGQWPATKDLDQETTTAILSSAIGILHWMEPKPVKQDNDGAAFR